MQTNKTMSMKYVQNNTSSTIRYLYSDTSNIHKVILKNLAFLSLLYRKQSHKFLYS